jgi:hypothetical protein
LISVIWPGWMNRPALAWAFCHARRRARQDAVVVVREALRRHQGVLAAGGASSEIGPLRLLPIERLRDFLALHGHQVDRAEAEILDPLGMPEQAGRWRRRIAERSRQCIAHVAL